MRRVGILGMTKRCHGNTGKKEELALMREWLQATMLRLHEEQETQFLLPVSSYFDMQGVGLCVEHRLNGRLYLPNLSFRKQAPTHLRGAMTAVETVGGAYYGVDRKRQLLKDADVLILMTDGDDPYVAQHIGKKLQVLFPWEQYVALLSTKLNRT